MTHTSFIPESSGHKLSLDSAPTYLNQHSEHVQAVENDEHLLGLSLTVQEMRSQNIEDY